MHDGARESRISARWRRCAFAGPNEECAEEGPGDGSLIRAALNDVARSGNMSRLARETGMSREGLYKALSKNGNPSFATVIRIARALGMHVRITA